MSVGKTDNLTDIWTGCLPRRILDRYCHTSLLRSYHKDTCILCYFM